IQAFTEVGTRPEIDLLQARSDQANSEVQLINAENDYATGRALLNQAMGVEAPAAYDVIGERSEPLPGEAGALEPLVDEAVRARASTSPRCAIAPGSATASSFRTLSSPPPTQSSSACKPR